jgi:Xaa-Pro aminopeptidase
MTEFAARRERLWHEARQEGLGALLISNPVNVTYLTGFSGESSNLLLAPGKAILVSDGRFTEQIAEECADVEVVIRPTTQTLSEATTAQLRLLGVASVGYESGHLTVAEFQGLSEPLKEVAWKADKERVEKLRQVKDAGEIAQVRGAIRIAEKAFAMFRAMLRPDDCEKDLADNLDHYVRRAGGKETAFPSIVAVGSRAALPHAPPTRRRVAESGMMLVDWGADGGFYKSDLTRVLWSHNNAATSGVRTQDKLREVFAVVLEAQRRAIAELRPGAVAKEIEAAARGHIADRGYGEYFTHSLGHGLGLQVHEAPFLRANADTSLEAGMIVTIEPGIYLPGLFGVRIEDDVLITPDGAEVLTSYPRDFEACRVEF